MKTLLSRYASLVVLCGGLFGIPPSAADAQDPPVQRLSLDSIYKLRKCGTHGPVLQRREATHAVQMALGAMVTCPEGPEVLARLLREAPRADTAYLGSVLGVSSLRHRGITEVLIQMLADRSRTDDVRLRVMGTFLRQLTGTLGSRIRVVTVGRNYSIDSLGTRRLVDSTRKAIFADGSHASAPAAIDPALRAEVVATIARMAADPTESPDMRIAARDVHAVLVRVSR